MTNRLLKKSLMCALVAGAALSVTNLALAADCPSALALPTATGANSVTFGDGISYALPILNLDVQSSPGQIQDCIVIATGANGAPVYDNGNMSAIDNAYQTPNGSINDPFDASPYFRTGDPLMSPDPDGAGQFVGDTANTWDITLAALSTFLAGNDLIVYFNHNQTKSGETIDENLFVWARIALVDNDDPTRTQYFYITSVPNFTGIDNFGAPGGDPYAYTGPQTTDPNSYPAGSDSSDYPVGGVGTGTGNGDADYMVSAQGHVCLNGPVGTGTPIACDGSQGPVVDEVDLNLGADHVANAVWFPEIQDILNKVGFDGYDVLQADIRMGCSPGAIDSTDNICPDGSILNNGYEQIFIASALVERPPELPEPSSLALISLGLLLAGGLNSRRNRGRTTVR